MKLKQFALIFVGLTLFCSCSVIQAPVTAQPSAMPLATPAPTPTSDPVSTVRFSATGDDLIHGQLYLQAQQRTADGSYDFLPLYEHVAPFYSEQDLNFINQETNVNDEIPPSSYPLFSSPAAVGKTIYDMGFRLIGMSNNHSYDLGASGIAATKRFWAAMPSDVLTFGLVENGKEDEIPVYDKNGLRFACLAYTQYTNGLPTPQDAIAHVIYTSDTETIERQIKQARAVADVVLVSVHWGNEDSHTTTDGQRALAQQMADWGADLIIGTHPHVLQGAEWLQREGRSPALVAYSLGNFVSAQSRPDEMIGAVLSCTFTKQGAQNIEIENVQFHPTVTHYGYNYSNVTVYFLKDYTAELARQHGVCTDYPYFNYDYIEDVVKENIPAEFLQSPS